jgi:glycosyltransferase involved in cell wall biosynthesis
LLVQDWLSRNPKLQNRVSILDFVGDSEVRDLFDHAAVFLFPSFYEGFGMPIIEAMSCGAPVVTSKIGAMIEVGGDAAVFVSDPKSTNEIGMSIAGILSDVEQWNDISARGLKHANAFSWKSAAEKHLDLYRKLMI